MKEMSLWIGLSIVILIQFSNIRGENKQFEKEITWNALLSLILILIRSHVN